MNPVEFEGQTRLLGPPGGMKRGECGALPIAETVIAEYPAMLSFWKPTAEDLEALNAGGHLRLCVYGTAHPPVWLDTVTNLVPLP